jgi:hypothetical protein
MASWFGGKAAAEGGAAAAEPAAAETEAEAPSGNGEGFFTQTWDSVS